MEPAWHKQFSCLCHQIKHGGARIKKTPSEGSNVIKGLLHVKAFVMGLCDTPQASHKPITNAFTGNTIVTITQKRT